MTDERVKKQYESLYGPFLAGDHAVGDRVKYAGGEGEVVWSCINAPGQFVYIVDSGGWPVEIGRHEIIELV